MVSKEEFLQLLIARIKHEHDKLSSKLPHHNSCLLSKKIDILQKLHKDLAEITDNFSERWGACIKHAQSTFMADIKDYKSSNSYNLITQDINYDKIAALYLVGNSNPNLSTWPARSLL